MIFWVVANLILLIAFWGNFYRRKNNLQANLYLTEALFIFSIMLVIWITLVFMPIK